METLGSLAQLEIDRVPLNGSIAFTDINVPAFDAAAIPALHSLDLELFADLIPPPDILPPMVFGVVARHTDDCVASERSTSTVCPSDPVEIRPEDNDTTIGKK